MERLGIRLTNCAVPLSILGFNCQSLQALISIILTAILHACDTRRLSSRKFFVAFDYEIWIHLLLLSGMPKEQFWQ